MIILAVEEITELEKICEKETKVNSFYSVVFASAVLAFSEVIFGSDAHF